MIHEALLGAFQVQGIRRNTEECGGWGRASHGKAKTRNNNCYFKYMKGRQLEVPVDLACGLKEGRKGTRGIGLKEIKFWTEVNYLFN